MRFALKAPLQQMRMLITPGQIENHPSGLRTQHSETGIEFRKGILELDERKPYDFGLIVRIAQCKPFKDGKILFVRERVKFIDAEGDDAEKDGPSLEKILANPPARERGTGGAGRVGASTPPVPVEEPVGLDGEPLEGGEIAAEDLPPSGPDVHEGLVSSAAMPAKARASRHLGKGKGKG